ncbi:MAG: RHS repeat-associated core domain-containing protein [Acidobacteria bacterium]|nr:RHS repeat-associated core domain-containing protein [Acidobacteriota bacterium]
MISDAEGRSFVFNGENKQAQIIKDGKLVGEYDYNGEGQRVRKRAYDADGFLQDTTVFVYSAGKLVAEYTTAALSTNPTTRYTATDMLGSPRVITDSEGNVISRRDFKPFGEEISSNTGERTITAKYGTADNLRQKFTTYQRDEETGLDFAEARMYENRHGRFTAVDPLLASGKSANPQTYNRFAYVGSNPLRFIDPQGLQAGTAPARIPEVPVNQPNPPAPEPPLSPPNTIEPPKFVGPPAPIEAVRRAVGFTSLTLIGAGVVILAMPQTMGPELGPIARQREREKEEEETKRRRGVAFVFVFKPMRVPGSQRLSIAHASITVITNDELSGAGFGVTSEVPDYIGSQRMITTDLRIFTEPGRRGFMSKVVSGFGPSPQSLQTAPIMIPLEDAVAAQRFQQESIRQPARPYSLETNSCFTHVGDVLRSGGVSGVGSRSQEVFDYLKRTSGAPLVWRARIGN